MLRGLDVPYPVLVDRDRDGYRAFGLGRGSLREMWSPGAVWPYARALVGGQRIDRPGRHPRQLGGDFVVDPEGRVAFSHPQASSDDRPPVGGSSSVSRRSPGRGRPTSDDIGGGPSAAGVRRGACGYPPERAGDRREAP